MIQVKCFRLLAETGDHSVGELLRAHFFLRDAFLEHVVGVDAVFERSEPCVVYRFGYVRLVDVDQHQDRARKSPDGFARF